LNPFTPRLNTFEMVQTNVTVLNHGFWGLLNIRGMALRLIISLIFLLNVLNGIQKKAGAARSCIAGNTDLLHKRLMEMSEDQPGKGLEMIIGCNSVDSAAIRFNQICDFACGSM